MFPVLSPDAERVVFSSNRDGSYDLFEKPANGTIDERPLLRTHELKVPMGFSPDGRFLLYTTQAPKTGVDLWVLPLGTGNVKPYTFVQTTFDEMAAEFSPNGQWVAYQSNASGRMEVYVIPFGHPGGPQQVSSNGGGQARWARDGKELFYVAADGRMTAVPVRVDSTEKAFDAGTPVPLFPARLATGANVPPSVGTRPQYDVTSDGRFLMNVSVDGAAAPPITVVLNWQVDVKE